VEFLQPRGLDEALAAKAAHPEAVPICGGTDLCVELNFDRRRPEAILDLSHVAELRETGIASDHVVVGAGVPYSRIIRDLAAPLPALAMASRTVGSPQIRNRGTVGGNLGTASPAGDALPPLLATGATVTVASTRGARDIAAGDFVLAPKRSALEPDELIVSITCPIARGAQQFSKIGTRNAMVIAVASLALSLDAAKRTVRVAFGSAGPTPLRAPEAERFLAGVLDEQGHWETLTPLAESAITRFGELVGQAARPIDDVRGTAAYRRHGLSVLGRRTLGWAWAEQISTRAGAS
jgi:CO/xanthine dehydrogenase FAD-binding subunit